MTIAVSLRLPVALRHKGAVELQQLRYFCAVVRTGSFTKGAEQEEVSQPSLSQQIHKLETELAGPLFERLGRSVKLTPIGQALLPRALAVLGRWLAPIVVQVLHRLAISGEKRGTHRRR